MSNGIKGTASAVPAVPTTGTPVEADQWEADALASIAAVTTPEDAEALLKNVKVAEQAFAITKLGEDRERRWTQLRLKAERRYGELLPPPRPGKKTSNTVLGDPMTISRARKVAKVPEPEFIEYLETSPRPSRKELLRKHAEPKDRPRPRQRGADGNDLWKDENVLAWAAKRMKAGASRDSMAAESKAGKYGWPVFDAYLGQNAADRVRAIVEDRQNHGDRTPRKAPKESGKRLRQLHAERRAGRTTTDLWHLQVAVGKAVGVLEGFDLPELDWSEETEALVLEIYEDLERHAVWNEGALDVVTAHMGEMGRQRKLKALRARADDPSSTPHERANAARLAQKLEEKRAIVSAARR